MVTLALTWMLDLFLLFTIWSSNGILSESGVTGSLISSGRILFGLLFFLISSVVFLIWIYRVHQDLWFLFEAYPITPAGAIARFVIPIYSLYGVWDVLDEMRTRFLPGFGKWIAAFYVLLIAQSFSSILPNTEPIYRPLLFLYLAVTVLYFFMTLKIHRGLAGRFADLPSIDTAAELAADPLAEEDTAVPLPAKTNAERRKWRNRWLITGVLGLFVVICAVSACGLLTVGASNVLRWFDWSYWGYFQALNERIAFDDSVATVLVEISFIENDSEESEVWLVISVETPLDCGARVANPCERLADEIAAFTLENYARIDEMDGLSMRMSTVHGDGTGGTTPGLEKQMSIDQWREELRAAAV